MPLAILLFLAFVLNATLMAQSSRDPNFGTWKLNVENRSTSQALLRDRKSPRSPRVVPASSSPSIGSRRRANLCTSNGSESLTAASTLRRATRRRMNARTARWTTTPTSWSTRRMGRSFGAERRCIPATARPEQTRCPGRMLWANGFTTFRSTIGHREPNEVGVRIVNPRRGNRKRGAQRARRATTGRCRGTRLLAGECRSGGGSGSQGCSLVQEPAASGIRDRVHPAELHLDARIVHTPLVGDLTLGARPDPYCAGSARRGGPSDPPFVRSQENA
jgi:hypothetical protein